MPRQIGVCLVASVGKDSSDRGMFSLSLMPRKLFRYKAATFISCRSCRASVVHVRKRTIHPWCCLYKLPWFSKAILTSWMHWVASCIASDWTTEAGTTAISLHLPLPSPSTSCPLASPESQTRASGCLVPGLCCPLTASESWTWKGWLVSCSGPTQTAVEFWWPTGQILAQAEGSCPISTGPVPTAA